MTNRAPQPDLIITLSGGCSVPIPELQEKIKSLLDSIGFPLVAIDTKPLSEGARFGYDGFTEDETVLIRYEEPVK